MKEKPKAAPLIKPEKLDFSKKNYLVVTLMRLFLGGFILRAIYTWKKFIPME